MLPELCLFTSSQQRDLTPADRMEDKHSTPFTRFAPCRQVSTVFPNSLFLLPVCACDRPSRTLRARAAAITLDATARAPALARRARRRGPVTFPATGGPTV